MEEGMMNPGFCLQSRGFHQAGAGGTKCGRWNPTAEQVKVLTELFRAGLRTPTTDQIQKISAELSFYGKIESKNVFYWFQNHKARERQKRRRVVSKDVDNKLASAAASAKYFGDKNQVSKESADRGIETLQLFPLSSYDDDESPPQKLTTLTKDYYFKENTCPPFVYNTNGINQVQLLPQLDLRLSFL